MRVMQSKLAELGPRLASLAVLLRASVLPAMPWMSTEGSDRIQVGQIRQYNLRSVWIQVGQIR